LLSSFSGDYCAGALLLLSNGTEISGPPLRSGALTPIRSDRQSARRTAHDRDHRAERIATRFSTLRKHRTVAVLAQARAAPGAEIQVGSRRRQRSPMESPASSQAVE
jgi:hypothetical protein